MKRVIVAFLFFAIAVCIFYLAPNYLIGEIYGKGVIRVVIDSKDITNKLPDDARIIDGEIMLSQDTIDIWFDKYLYYDEKYETIITTSDNSVAKLKLDNKEIDVNGNIEEINVAARKIDEKIYIPIKNLEATYNIQVNYNDKIIITKNDTPKSSIVLEEDTTLKKYEKNLSRKISTAYKNETLDIYEINENGWLLVRDIRGNIGYVDGNKIAQKIERVPESHQNDKNLSKVNLVWDYAINYIPDRTGENKIKGIDVIAPTCLNVKNSEECKIVSTLTKEYVDWAHAAGYKVWVTIKNDGLQINETSKVITDMKKRELLVENILATIKRYNIDGVNIDFEYMYKKDVNEYSQFIRELSARLRQNDYIVSVDVTVPDGSDSWSLCYDRDALADAVDYMVLMAYDMVGAREKKEGSSAPLYWVRSNIEKMLNREEIPKEKLILGIPLYSKTCVIQDGRIVEAGTWYMNDSENKKNDKNSEWDEEAGQYIIRYNSDNKTRVIWLENKDSIKEKIELANEYEIAGTAYWRLGFENEEVWDLLK